MITAREKKLMLSAAENMFWAMKLRHGIEETSISPAEELDLWLNSTIADNGGTVEQYLDSENRDT
ncbi:MAG: hypothetical protein AAF434_17150 [Pseudomonadota bacterium]